MLQRENPWKKLDFVKRISKLPAHLFKLVSQQKILLMTSHQIPAELRYVTVAGCLSITSLFTHTMDIREYDCGSSVLTFALEF